MFTHNGVKMNSPIDKLLDTVDWRPITYDEIPEEIYATHEGVLMVGDVTFRVYVLSDGRRVVDSDDIHKFFGTETTGDNALSS